MLTLYGIPNCDTVKKARTWLDAHGLPYHFHDYKKAGIDRATLQRWCEHLGHDKVINTRGTTWRKLPEQQRSQLDAYSALSLMLAQPSLIRRPIIEKGAILLLGFDQQEWQTLL
jgi:arsenate reductase (glutaredoxin)